MSEIVYQISSTLCQILSGVPIGTNLGLFYLLWALLSGRFLPSRGADFAALLALGLPKEAVRRAEAALCYGHWKLQTLLDNWQHLVQKQRRWQAPSYDGIRPVASDLIGFFRPHLQGGVGKHYTSLADKALPAVVLGVSAAVGTVGTNRLALPRHCVRANPTDTGEHAVKRDLLEQTGDGLARNEAEIVDAGFGLALLLEVGVPRFVARQDKNFTARKNAVPPYKGRGRYPEYGEIVRPLARERAGKEIAGTRPDSTARFRDGRYWVKAKIFENLVLSDAKPGSPSFRCVVISHPRYKEPLVLGTNLKITAWALWRLYRDRWPIEQLPLAAKQMLGCARSFVFGQESRFRLPELALLAGNVLSYVAACSPVVATGFWDRCARATCGRLRRVLSGVDFSELTLPQGQLRKKNSPTAHLPKGVKAHRRHRAGDAALRAA
jgi:hypothetical protein